mmetsp:Transcript_19223/g.53588  ORF Transcript_19223/g.53588 Transcript_19223/m.53588 type:complete len:224 (-) Transcript_19223:324-995(-)
MAPMRSSAAKPGSGPLRLDFLSVFLASTFLAGAGCGAFGGVTCWGAGAGGVEAGGGVGGAGAAISGIEKLKDGIAGAGFARAAGAGGSAGFSGALKLYTGGAGAGSGFGAGGVGASTAAGAAFGAGAVLYLLSMAFKSSLEVEDSLGAAGSGTAGSSVGGATPLLFRLDAELSAFSRAWARSSLLCSRAAARISAADSAYAGWTVLRPTEAAMAAARTAPVSL